MGSCGHYGAGYGAETEASGLSRRKSGMPGLALTQQDRGASASTPTPIPEEPCPMQAKAKT
jgi:hypothetical protein